MRDSDGRVLATAEGRFLPMSEAVHNEIVPLLKMPGGPAENGDI
jgi:hypothetical protein